MPGPADRSTRLLRQTDCDRALRCCGRTHYGSYVSSGLLGVDESRMNTLKPLGQSHLWSARRLADQEAPRRATNTWRRSRWRSGSPAARRSASPVSLSTRRPWLCAGSTRNWHFRLDRAVIGAHLTVSLLHGLWDGLAGLLDGILAPGTDVLAALAVVSGAGLVLLSWRWRQAVRIQAASSSCDQNSWSRWDS